MVAASLGKLHIHGNPPLNRSQVARRINRIIALGQNLTFDPVVALERFEFKPQTISIA